MNTPTERQAAFQVLKAIVESLKMSPNGLPGGILFAAMHQNGCTFEQFTGIMQKVCATGMVELRGARYHFIPEAEIGQTCHAE